MERKCRTTPTPEDNTVRAIELILSIAEFPVKNIVGAYLAAEGLTVDCEGKIDAMRLDKLPNHGWLEYAGWEISFALSAEAPDLNWLSGAGNEQLRECLGQMLAAARGYYGMLQSAYSDLANVTMEVDTTTTSLTLGKGDALRRLVFVIRKKAATDSAKPRFTNA